MGRAREIDGRRYLIELNKTPKIDEEIIHQQLYQLDLEEERLKIL